jgi:hypothetical protein
MSTVTGQSEELDILQKLDAVKHKVAEARKQALCRNRLKDICLLKSYSDGEFSLVLYVEAGVKVDEKLTAYSPHSGTFVQFAFSISRDSRARDVYQKCRDREESK